MDMDQSAVFLAGSILFALGIVVLVAGVVAVNNIISKYWKPVRIFTADSWKSFNPPTRYMTEEEVARIAPHMEPTDKKPL